MPPYSYGVAVFSHTLMSPYKHPYSGKDKGERERVQYTKSYLRQTKLIFHRKAFHKLGCIVPFNIIGMAHQSQMERNGSFNTVNIKFF